MEQGTITRKQLRQLFETAIAQCLEAEISDRIISRPFVYGGKDHSDDDRA